MVDFKPILRVMGVLLMLLGALMFTGIPIAYAYDSGDAGALLYAGLTTILIGTPLWFFTQKAQLTIRKREGYLIVATGWLVMVTFGSLPYIYCGLTGSIIDALFETVSGMTTTGATIIEDIEALPRGILYWRSLTQWIGGMGIIVLTVAIFPLLGIGGIELFVAEAPGPTSDKLHPRIRETAKRLWVIYVALTALLTGLLWLEGMTLYDAVNHAFTTMATGGFSTRNASMAYFDQADIQYTIAAFMFIAGTNYTVIYYGLKRRFDKVWESDEFKAYWVIVFALTAVVTFSVIRNTHHSFEQAFRESLFMIISVITTTGYVTADYTAWSSGMTMLFFVMMFLGACAGSTSGGIKLIRHLVFFRNSFMEFRRIIHPRAILPLKLNGKVVPPRILTHIIIFLLLYLILFVMGSLVLAASGLDFLTAIGATATSLGNVGPGIGEVGPVQNFAFLKPGVKVFLAILMLLGRLEIFTILVLFSPYFWRSN